MSSLFQPTFAAETASVRVRFKAGLRTEIDEEVARLGGSRAVVITTPEQASLGETIRDSLGASAVGHLATATMHTPVDVTEAATAEAGRMKADCLVAIGGGSTIGLAKAIALRTGLPQIAIPTTYAGSEATPVVGQTENGQKTTLTDERVRPKTILYDAELVATLPSEMTATSALNAMAHAVEALYAKERNPLSSLLALEGLRAFATALPRVMAAPDDLVARGETLYGAWLCGTVLGQVGMALHHKLCHTLGGSFGLSHAQTHAVMLPHAVAFNEAAVPELLEPLAEIMGHDRAGQGLFVFARRIGAPSSLRELGLNETDLDRAADLAVERPYWNPRTIERNAILTLLEDAWDGRMPNEAGH